VWRRLLPYPRRACWKEICASTCFEHAGRTNAASRCFQIAWFFETFDLSRVRAQPWNSLMGYLLDANVFIQAKNLHYGLDFCPAFWDWLLANNATGKVFSIEKVEDEIKAGSDELAQWASNLGAKFFLRPHYFLLAAPGQVSTWATNQNYEPAAVNTFLQVADYYLVGHAIAHKHVVVSHEIASISTKKIKIPNVCIGLNVKCVTPFEMLRNEKARFVLAK